mmetsp:Transcript_15093/g.22232  ORF Transcript_15093/g.22232 Transcript_15093/m.22232 type:complete len:662 (-) Transcript_15093:108-2093(-)
MTFCRLFAIISILSAINTAFAQQYQAQARTFVESDPSPYRSGNVFIDLYYGSQRYALACLFFATNLTSNKYMETDEAPLEPWEVATNWTSEVGECDWYGVTCDDGNFVTGIDLSGNNLGGTFPNEFSLLGSTLNYLDISNNPTASFGGGNFWISEMVYLTHLDLHNTNFDGRGLPDISELVQLKYLDLSFTYFWYNLDRPDKNLFANLDQLETLDISGNSYPGPVPASILNLPSLKKLYIYDSDFTGSMDFINDLPTDLVEIWADGNFWDEGPLPTGIRQFSNLKGLSLTNTGRTGTIPAGLGDLQELQRVWLYGNSLVGTIPGEISNLDKLIIFQVEDNLLLGSMPDEVCELFDNPFGLLKVLASDCTTSGGSVNCPCCNCCEAPCDCDSGGCAGDEPSPPTGGFCFSGESTVDVLNKGTVKMEDLKIGDKVLVGVDGKYEPIYSFGHFDTSVVKTEFLQIRTSTSSGLEMTPNHLIFMQGNEAVPASSIKVGDKVMMASGKTDTVVSIQEVKRTGIFAPFTSSGTIVTNGILSSSFATIQKSHYVSLGGFEVPLTYHQLGVVFESPHRLLCHLWGLDECARYERYDEGGTSQWVEKPMVAFQWLLEQNIVVSGILFFISFAFLCMINLIEMLVVSPVYAMCLMAAFVADRRRRRVNKML